MNRKAIKLRIEISDEDARKIYGVLSETMDNQELLTFFEMFSQETGACQLTLVRSE